MTSDDLMTVKPARSVRESEAVKALQADNEKLRGLLRGCLPYLEGDKCDLDDSMIKRVREALGGGDE